MYIYVDIHNTNTNIKYTNTSITNTTISCIDTTSTNTTIDTFANTYMLPFCNDYHTFVPRIPYMLQSVLNKDAYMLLHTPYMCATRDSH